MGGILRVFSGGVSKDGEMCRVPPGVHLETFPVLPLLVANPNQESR